ncbi:hypothetical protein WDW86_20965 [Bdellovibrionota bacterium FG-2]
MASSKIRLWPTALACLVISGVLAHFLAVFLNDTFLKAPTPDLIAATFVPSQVPGCRPEPMEFLSYFSFSALAPLLFLGSFGFLSLSTSLRAKQLALAISAQFIGLIFIFYNLVIQNREVRYVLDYRVALRTLLQGSAIFLILYALKSRTKLFQLSSTRWLPHILGVFFCVLRLLPSVFTNETLDAAFGTVTYHLAFTMGEFAAAVNGRVPHVDFDPLYQHLLPIVAQPYFALFGLSVGSFTCLMGWLSLLAFLCIFFVLLRLTKRPWLALGCQILFVAMSTYASASGPGGNLLNPFNYYAVGPLRYFGPYVLLAVTTAFLKPSRVRLAPLGLGFCGTLVALNNLDFGLPALGAAAIAFGVWLFQTTHQNARSLLFALLEFVLASFLGLLVYALTLRSLGGEWPHLGEVFQFQKYFGYFGYGMTPLAPFGLHWIVSLTFFAAVVTGLIRDKKEHAFANAVLLYCGVFGTGALSYYIGRSYPEVILSLFSIWSLTTLVLATEWFISIRKTWRFSLETWLPSLTLGLLLTLFLAAVAEAPSPLEQVSRLTQRSESLNKSRATSVSLIQKYTTPGENVAILFTHGHWLAHEAGVNNLFFLAHPISIFLKEQEVKLFALVDSEKINAVFGTIAPAIQAGLLHKGFQLVETSGDFEIWHRRP